MAHFCQGLKRTKKAITTTSKFVNVMVTIIIIVILLGISSPYWSSKPIIVPLAASIGGMVVFLGLWLEKEAGWKLKRSLLNRRRDVIWAKFIEEVGWWLLMLGIILEILTGGAIAAYDIVHDIRTTSAISKIDPLNQPVRSLSAQVILYASNNVPIPRVLECWSRLQLEPFEKRPRKLDRFSIRMDSVRPMVTRRLGASVGYVLTFSFVDSPPINGEIGNGVSVTNLLNALDIARFQVFDSPITNLAISDGSITISMNGAPVRSVLLPPASMDDMWVAQINGTNVVIRPP